MFNVAVGVDANSATLKIANCNGKDDRQRNQMCNRPLGKGNKGPVKKK